MKGFLSLIAVFVFSSSLIAQDQGWHMLDPENDEVQGISVERTYGELLQGKESRPVIVAVIDGGVDYMHEDLKSIMWINTDEVAGNGIDDDKNGYVDDVYGWNFIGNKDGKNVHQDTYELTREYVRLEAKYGEKSKDDISKKQAKEFDYWQEVKSTYETKSSETKLQYELYESVQKNLLRYHELIKLYLDIEEVTMNDLMKIQTADSIIRVAGNLNAQIINIYGPDVDFQEVSEEFKETADYFGDQYKYGYNTEFDPRNIVGDNYTNSKEKIYGNADVKGPDADHGTHVAGIIAADRTNDLGIKGIADNVQIMAVRAVPDGDERDKDVANAIIYAVDNGAQVINMSFGKDYSFDKAAVDKAVKYAEKNGVLLVHAAGNDNKNIDETSNYPTRFIDKGGEAKNWLEIGASGWGKNENFVASFSNFGKNTVDVFAPGVEIYSTTMDSKYDSYPGTSMAAPMVSGLAALLLSYYPELSMTQVRQIILDSSRKFDGLQVTRPDNQETVEFSSLSRSGGLINVYEAVKMAESMKIQQGG